MGKKARRGPRPDCQQSNVTEEDEDDKDGICFVTLESRFESKETALNW